MDPAATGSPSAPVAPKVSDIVETDEEAANFLIQATYGPTLTSIAELRQLGYSAWFRQQIALDADYFLDDALDRVAADTQGSNLGYELHKLDSVFEKAQYAPDQLRQRAHYALSQIFAASTQVIQRKSYMHAAYKDIMVDNAFGQFRDLLHDVTYNPLMGTWLTYVGNRKADPISGFAPDENYAREVMQLFTIGLEELNLDGSPKLTNGQPIESYTLGDVVELAKVFTGLYYNGLSFG